MTAMISFRYFCHCSTLCQTFLTEIPGWDCQLNGKHLPDIVEIPTDIPLSWRFLYKKRWFAQGLELLFEKTVPCKLLGANDFLLENPLNLKNWCLNFNNNSLNTWDSSKINLFWHQKIEGTAEKRIWSLKLAKSFIYRDNSVFHIQGM